jgi:nitrate/nitrite-specific signal transduction histidine kinase
MYALRYRSRTEKAQAMSDLQITLPLFQQEQALLATNSDPDVQRLVQQARPDYLSLVSTVHFRIAHPNEPVNQGELAAVLLYDQRFFSPMDTLTTVLQQHAERQTEQFLLVKGIAEGSCVLIAFCWLCIDRSLGRRRSVNNVASNVDATGII